MVGFVLAEVPGVTASKNGHMVTLAGWYPLLIIHPHLGCSCRGFSARLAPWVTTPPTPTTTSTMPPWATAIISHIKNPPPSPPHCAAACCRRLAPLSKQRPLPTATHTGPLTSPRVTSRPGVTGVPTPVRSHFEAAASRAAQGGCCRRTGTCHYRRWSSRSSSTHFD